MTKAVFRKSNGALIPASDDADEIMRSIKDGREVMVDVRAARNPSHHRKFMKMLSKVIEAGSWDYDQDKLLTWCKFKVGHVEVIEINGRRYVSPKSISFESMPQDKFQRFYERAVYHICHELAGPELAAELSEMADGPYAANARAA